MQYFANKHSFARNTEIILFVCLSSELIDFHRVEIQIAAF